MAERHTQGNLAVPAGKVPPAGKRIHAPCCEVFYIEDGKISSYHCYVAVPVLLEQLAAFMNLEAALSH